MNRVNSQSQRARQVTQDHALRVKNLQDRLKKQEIEMSVLAEYLASPHSLFHQLESSEQLAEFGYVLRPPEVCYLKYAYYITQVTGKVTNEDKTSRVSSHRYHLLRLPERTHTSMMNSLKLYKFLQANRITTPGDAFMFLLRLNQIFALRTNNANELYLMYDRFVLSFSFKHRIWNAEPVKPEEIKIWALQLASAVDRLNLMGIANRFIRPETVLLSRGEVVKLANFDMALQFSNHTRVVQADQVNGVLNTLSRSMLDHLPPEYFGRTYDCSNIDVWSIGNLIVNILTGGTPFCLDAGINEENIKLSTQWRQSACRVTLLDEIRSLLDDIFQPADLRMIAYDMKNDYRLLKSNQYNRHVKANPYYRIDLVTKLNVYDDGSHTRPPSHPKVANQSSFYAQTVKLFNFKGYHSFKAEHDFIHFGLRILRSQSFTKDMDHFVGDDYMRGYLSKKRIAKSDPGTKSAVSMTLSINESGSPCLCKIFLLARIPYRHRNMLLNEGSRMMRFFSEEKNCPSSIHKVIEVFVVDKLKFYAFYEDLPMCRPLSYLVARTESIPAGLVSRWFNELAFTIDYLTGFGVSHRYVRPEFIYITGENRLKLTHMEMACFVWNPNQSKQVLRHGGVQDDLVQLWNHLPPEVWFDKYDALRLDVWSFGVCLVHACTGKFPFTTPVVLGEAQGCWKTFKNEFNTRLRTHISILDKVFVSAEYRIDSTTLADELKTLNKTMIQVTSHRVK